MNRLKYFVLAAISVVAMLAVQSCENDDYDTGDVVNLNQALADITFRNGRSTVIDADDIGVLVPQTEITLTSAPADTTIRCYLLYSRSDKDNTVDVKSVSRVAMPAVLTTDSVKERRLDPFVLSSSWMSRENSYINMYVKLPNNGVSMPRMLIGCDNVSAQGAGAANLTMYYANPAGGSETSYSNYLSLRFNTVVPPDMKRAHSLPADFAPDTVRVAYKVYGADTLKTLTFIHSSQYTSPQ